MKDAAGETEDDLKDDLFADFNGLSKDKEAATELYAQPELVEPDNFGDSLSP